MPWNDGGGALGEGRSAANRRDRGCGTVRIEGTVVGFRRVTHLATVALAASEVSSHGGGSLLARGGMAWR